MRGMFFTRLTRADVERLEQLIGDCFEELRKVKATQKADRGRLAKAERSFRDTVHNLLASPPKLVAQVMEEEYEEDGEAEVDGEDAYRRRLAVPESRH